MQLKPYDCSNPHVVVDLLQHIKSFTPVYGDTEESTRMRMLHGSIPDAFDMGGCMCLEEAGKVVGAIRFAQKTTPESVAYVHILDLCTPDTDDAYARARETVRQFEHSLADAVEAIYVEFSPINEEIVSFWLGMNYMQIAEMDWTSGPAVVTMTKERY